MLTGKQSLTFQMIIHLQGHAAKKAAWPWRGRHYQSTWHNIPEHLNLQQHCCKNFKPHKTSVIITNNYIFQEYRYQMLLYKNFECCHGYCNLQCCRWQDNLPYCATEISVKYPGIAHGMAWPCKRNARIV